MDQYKNSLEFQNGIKRNKILTYFLLIFLFIILAIIFLRNSSQNIQNTSNTNNSVENLQTCGNYQSGTVKINNKIINVDIADNDCKRELGLSGRVLLNDGNGMIFVFEKDGNYGFWMKQMNFALDIIWISADFHIVGMERSLSPSTYPKVFGQNYMAQYVLELPAGYSNKNNIKIGDKIIFSEKNQ